MAEETHNAFASLCVSLRFPKTSTGMRREVFFFRSDCRVAVDTLLGNCATSGVVNNRRGKGLEKKMTTGKVLSEESNARNACENEVASNITHPEIQQKQYKIRLSGWTDFYRLADWLHSEKVTWVFRGHEDSSWELTSTWDRFVKRYRTKNFSGNPKEKSTSLDKALAAYFKFFSEQECETMRKEHAMIEEFKRMIICNHYLGEGTLPYLMMMQHYGIPTRLLDFSYSLFVALYFAYENVEKTERDDEPERAIWAIKLDKINKWLQENCKTDGTNVKMRECDHMELAKSILSGNPKGSPSKGIVPILYATNPRMMAQKGVFLLSFTKESCTDSFANNIYSVLKCNPTLLFDHPPRKNTSLKDFIAMRDRCADSSAKESFEDEARKIVKIESEHQEAFSRYNVSLDDFLAIKDKSDIHLLKFVFAKEMRAEARAVLEQANIDETSIFPDAMVDVSKLKRIGRSLKYRFLNNLY